MPSYQGCRGYGNPHTDGNGIGMGIWFSPVGIPIWISIWISPYGYPYGDLYGDPHREKSHSYSQHNYMGMGISVWISIRVSQYGSPYPWNCVENRNMIFPCGNPHMDPHTDGNGIGMGIWFSPVGIPTGKNHIPILNTITWVWGYQYEYPYGYPNMDPHTHGIVLRIGIWFSPVGIPIWISIWGYLYGDPHGDSHRNPSGMRWEWEWKFPPHGNPASYCILSISHNNYAYLFIELYYYVVMNSYT